MVLDRAWFDPGRSAAAASSGTAVDARVLTAATTTAAAAEVTAAAAGAGAAVCITAETLSVVIAPARAAHPAASKHSRRAWLSWLVTVAAGTT